MATSGVLFTHSEADTRKVKRVQFGIIGPDECKAASVCEIKSEKTFEDGRPVPNGLMDPLLGAIDHTFGTFLSSRL